MGAMDRDADAAAHDDAVDERDIRFAIALDLGVERVFLPEIFERFVMATGTTEIVEGAQIPAGGEGAPTIGGDDHTGDRGIAFPPGQLLRERTHHGE